MIRIGRKYSFGGRSRRGSLVISLLVALLLLGGATLTSWWTGEPLGRRPMPPPHADLRGAPARIAAEILYVVDGDTFDARLTVGPDRVVTARVRLRGVDTPELHGQCAAEERDAAAARGVLRDLLADGGVILSSPGTDKYGRVLADVSTRRTASVAAALLAAGVARPYQGGRRLGWCDRG